MGHPLTGGSDSVREVISKVRLYLLDQIGSVSLIPILTGRWTLLTRLGEEASRPRDLARRGSKVTPEATP